MPGYRASAADAIQAHQRCDAAADRVLARSAVGDRGVLLEPQDLLGHRCRELLTPPRPWQRFVVDQTRRVQPAAGLRDPLPIRTRRHLPAADRAARAPGGQHRPHVVVSVATWRRDLGGRDVGCPTGVHAAVHGVAGPTQRGGRLVLHAAWRGVCVGLHAVMAAGAADHQSGDGQRDRERANDQEHPGAGEVHVISGRVW